jgi:hypothetical protein
METMATDHAVMIHSMHHVEPVLQACTCCWVYLATSCQRVSKICTKGCATLAVWTSWMMMCSFLVTVGWDQLYCYGPTGNTNTRTSTSSAHRQHYFYHHHHHRHEWKSSSSHTRRAYLFVLEMFLCYVLLAVGLGVLYLFRRLFDSKRQRGGRQHLSVPQRETVYDDNNDDGERAYYYHQQQNEERVLFVEERDEEQEPDSLLAVRPRSFSLVLLCQEMGGDLVVFVDHSQWIRKRLTKRLLLALMVFGLYYRLLLLVLDLIVNLSSSSTSHDSNDRGDDNNKNGNGHDDSHNASMSSSSSSSSLPAFWDDDTTILISLLGVYPVLFLVGAWGIQLVWTKSRQRPPTTTTTTTTNFSYEENRNNHEGEYSYYLDDGANIDQMFWDRDNYDNGISSGSLKDSRMSLL